MCLPDTNKCIFYAFQILKKAHKTYACVDENFQNYSIVVFFCLPPQMYSKALSWRHGGIMC